MIFGTSRSDNWSTMDELRNGFGFGPRILTSGSNGKPGDNLTA